MKPHSWSIFAFFIFFNLRQKPVYSFIHELSLIHLLKNKAKNFDDGSSLCQTPYYMQEIKN